MENVELPLVYRGIPPKKRKALARKALEQVGLQGAKPTPPASCPGDNSSG